MKWVLLSFLLFSHLLPAQRQVAFLSTAHLTESISTGANPDFVEVPFELINGMIFVQAQVNNQTGYFILDTGAPMLVLNRSSQYPVMLTNTITAAGCSGNVQVGEQVIRHFYWAGMEKYELQALTTDLSHLEVATGRPIMGLIGYNLFKHRELFLDYEEQRLILFASDQNPLHRALTPIYTSQLTMQGHLPIIEFSMGRQTMRFGLDTGSETNLIDRCKAAAIDQTLIDTIREEEMQGLDRRIRRVPVIRVAESYWNNLPMDQLHFLVTDLCHLKNGQSLSLDGLLGYNFFRPLKISINYQKKEFYLWQNNSSM